MATNLRIDKTYVLEQLHLALPLVVVTGAAIRPSSAEMRCVLAGNFPDVPVWSERLKRETGSTAFCLPRRANGGVGGRRIDWV
jgi:hypothetical protein